MWEDALNVNGGKWIVRLKKGIASRMWENLIIAMISEQFDVGDEICGAVLSIRSNEDMIALWNKSADSPKINLQIRDTFKSVLSLPSDVVMEYKAHKNALVDQTSFRNTAIFK
jgi:translation initiation factor 4E